MLAALARSLFGTANDRIVKGLDKPVARINALEPDLVNLSDEELRGKTTEFRDRIAKGETLDDLLPEAFAVVREGAKRALGQRHFDVQLKGGMVLHQGKIAEMKTGEGKNAGRHPAGLPQRPRGQGRARRHRQRLPRPPRFRMDGPSLPLPRAHGRRDRARMDDDQRRAAYACDVTYATNNELGFDYLRDNMKFRLDAMAQRPLQLRHRRRGRFSILIDEARTPLIISGPAEDSSELYRRARQR